MPERIPGGYYIKARVIKNKKIHFMPPYVREIWDYCLREANYADSVYGPYTVKRGQLFRSYSEIREDLCWFIGYRKMMYDENQTKKAMKALRENDMIDTMREPGGVLITVLNYDFYQDPNNYESTNESTNENTAKELLKHHGGATNNKKNKKNKKERIKNTFSNEFEECWKIHPKRNGTKQGKKPAYDLFEKLTIEDKRKCYWGIKNYNDFCSKSEQSAMDLEKFIRKRFFNDYQKKIILDDKKPRSEIQMPAEIQ